ncbi:CPCC family cysteine-rich protein [Amphritea atlantica]|uniref:CPCC family cysteine-rich protein n=1 Tax=Amphritea atlantica TaxID=355243 RepID=UPI000B86FB1E|nr:CPCC family cysteine-rich protein [Amphritea atlantica]
MNHQCPCCENRTLPGDDIFPGSFYVCPVCYWEDDNVQYDDPNFSGGANKESLNQARSNYKEFGAINKEMLQYVRPPAEEEKSNG